LIVSINPARDKKLQLSQATKLKSIISRKVSSLEVDVKKHREIVNNLRDDGKQHILRLLGDHRRFYLAFNHLKPSVRIDQHCLQNLKKWFVFLAKDNSGMHCNTKILSHRKFMRRCIKIAIWNVDFWISSTMKKRKD